MSTLPESELSAVLNSFVEELAKFVGAVRVGQPIPLIIDDRKIANRDDIASSNGRYRFRDPDVWNHYIPNAHSPGVYLFFNADGIAIYVGKSEADGGIGKRVAAHIGCFKNGDFPYLAFPEAQYVITIPLPYSPYLAPALESFLLSKHAFQYNLSLAQRDRIVAGCA